MCYNPIFVDKLNRFVNCGKCLECASSISRNWSFRLACELSTNYNALFITLTYDDVYLDSYNLKKKDLQLYLKRLRYYLNGRKIKYFACGEYGDQSFRPHFHLIIFNVSWSDSELLNKSWSKGIVDIAPVETGSINYVTGYVEKKIYDDFDYKGNGYIPPFRVMSKKIGYDFLVKNKDYFFNKMCYTYGGKEFPLPRYFKDNIGLNTFNPYYVDYINNKYSDYLKKLVDENNIDLFFSENQKSIFTKLDQKNYFNNRKVNKKLLYEKYNKGRYVL